MKIIKKFLDDFANVSGQRISLEKSKLYFSPNFDRVEVGRISTVAGIPITDDLGRYLGSQLVHRRQSKGMDDQLMEKYKAWMEGWKNRCLSLAGRITLANSVILSLLVYHMQTSRLPMSVLKNLDQMVRRCI